MTISVTVLLELHLFQSVCDVACCYELLGKGGRRGWGGLIKIHQGLKNKYNWKESYSFVNIINFFYR